MTLLTGWLQKQHSSVKLWPCNRAPRTTRKAQVIGINGTKEAIDAIKSGKLLASGDYNGFAQGCLGTMMAIRSLRNQPVIAEIVLKPTVITKDNYQPFDVPLEQRTCPTFEEAGKLAGK